MQLFHRYHHHDMHTLFQTDFWRFELSIWLHVLARSMIAVFIPIFLLTMGWVITDVVLFYLIYTLIDVSLNFTAKWLTYKLGARIVLILGTLSFIAFFACLYSLTAGNWALLLAMALFAAIYDTFYWVSHIYYFMVCEKSQGNISQGVSFLYIAKRVAGVLAPAIGAVILIFFNQDTLTIISAIALALSALPLFYIHKTPDRPKKRPKTLREFFPNGQGLREYVIQGLYSFHTVAEGIFWPIFIYLLFETVESVAVIPIIISISTIIFSYFAGHIKKQRRHTIMALGAFLIAATWLLRLVVENNIFYYGTILLIGLFSVLVTIPLDSDLMEKGERKDPLATAAYRNFFAMWPRIILFGGLYLLLEVFHASFLLAAAAMLVIMAMNVLLVMKKPVQPLKEPTV